MSPLAPMMVATLLLTGMGVALLGSIKVPLARRLAIDEARVGGLVSLFGFTLSPVIFAAGFLTDLAGRQVVLIAGSCVFAASLAVLARARSYPLALLGVLLFSAGWALQINVGNVLTLLAFPGPSKAYSFNLANFVFGLGAFLTPVATAMLVGRLSLQQFLAVLAALALLPVAFGALLASAVFYGEPVVGAEAAVTSESPVLELLRNPYVWLLGMGLFFYGPLEASLAAWTTTLLAEKGLGEKPAATMLSVFWLTFMAARLATALTLPEGYEAPFLFALAVACLVVVLVGVLGRGVASGVAMVVGAGLCFGPIFPTLMAVLSAKTPEHLRGRAVGLFFAIGGIGWTLIPILIGAYARRTSLTRALVIAAGAAVGLIVVVGQLWLWLAT